jgi:putative membrane protein
MRALMVCLFALYPSLVEAHERAAASGPSPWDALAWLALAASGVLYALGRRRLRARGAVTRRAEAMAFWCGWSAMAAAVSPLIDTRAATSFAMHMVQHELLMVVGAPLIIAGRPLSTALWGAPDALRRWAAPLLQGRLTRTFVFLSSPAVAWALHGLAIWIWHAPVLYEAAVRHEALHAVQHATFVGTSALFWWGLVHGRYGRAGYGAAVFYVFTTAVHTGVLGALFTFMPEPIYGLYAIRADDPLRDQQLAGLLMWIPAGFVLTLAGVALFAAWLAESERRARCSRTRRGV